MVGRAKSQSKKDSEAREIKRKLLVQAVSMYQAEQEKPKKERKGLRTVCQLVEKEYYSKSRKWVKLDHKTLSRLASGGQSMADFNFTTKAWLTREEEEVVVQHVLELAERGFPVTHRRLKEHVDELLRARLGSKFPMGGVGVNWTGRFVQRHSGRLGTYWSRGLDNARGRAVNETTHKAWFELLGDTLKKYNIEEDCIYGADESGFAPGCGTKKFVIGGKGQKVQYQQRDGNRENITVMVTICADGTSQPPAVIYKGKAFLAKWNQENPLNAS